MERALHVVLRPTAPRVAFAPGGLRRVNAPSSYSPFCARFSLAALLHLNHDLSSPSCSPQVRVSSLLRVQLPNADVQSLRCCIPQVLDPSSRCARAHQAHCGSGCCRTVPSSRGPRDRNRKREHSCGSGEGFREGSRGARGEVVSSRRSRSARAR